MKARNKMMWLKALALWFCAMLAFTGCASKTESYQDKYDLGVKYVSEGNYEEAIIALNAAIEIDSKRVDAYIQRAGAYLSVADDTSIQQAKSDYQYALTLDETNADAYLGLARILYVFENNPDGAIEILKTGLEKVPQNSDILNYYNEISSQIEWKIRWTKSLSELEPYMQSQDWVGISNTSAAQSNYIGQSWFPCYSGLLYLGETDNRGIPSGNGIGCICYHAPSESSNDGFVHSHGYYYGQWSDGFPNGYGSYIYIWGGNEETPAEVNLVAIVGNWENGLPNGNCKFIDPYYLNGSAEAEGTALDGKWINEVHWTDTAGEGVDGYFPVADKPGCYGLTQSVVPEDIWPIGDATEIVVSNELIHRVIR